MMPASLFSFGVRMGNETLADYLKNRIANEAMSVLTTLHELSVKVIITGLDKSWTIWHRYQWTRYGTTFWKKSGMYRRVRETGIMSNITFDTWRLFKEEYFELAGFAARAGFAYFPDPGVAYGAASDVLDAPFLVLDVLYVREETTVLRVLSNNGRIYSLFLGESSARPQFHFQKVEI